MNTDELYCVRCANKLEVEEVMDYECDEYGPTTYLICPNCGARFEVTEPSEQRKQEYDFYKEGEDISCRLNEIDINNGHCLNCGHTVHVSNNFMLSDYDDTITDENDDKMNFVLNECPHCGCWETRWDTSENEKKIHPYWKEDLEEKENEEKK